MDCWKSGIAEQNGNYALRAALIASTIEIILNNNRQSKKGWITDEIIDMMKRRQNQCQGKTQNTGLCTKKFNNKCRMTKEEWLNQKICRNTKKEYLTVNRYS